MAQCPIHDVRMRISSVPLLTGKVARVNYCSRCDDVYIPESEFRKYDEDAALRRRLASAVRKPLSKLEASRKGRKLSITV